MRIRARWAGVLEALIAAGATYRPDQALRVAGCSQTFAGRQDPDATYRELVAPMIGGFASELLRVHVDRASQTVEVDSVLSGMVSAVHTPDTGAA